jgi:hypothetical protein
MVMKYIEIPNTERKYDRSLNKGKVQKYEDPDQYEYSPSGSTNLFVDNPRNKGAYE